MKKFISIVIFICLVGALTVIIIKKMQPTGKIYTVMDGVGTGRCFNVCDREAKKLRCYDKVGLTYCDYVCPGNLSYECVN